MKSPKLWIVFIALVALGILYVFIRNSSVESRLIIPDYSGAPLSSPAISGTESSKEFADCDNTELNTDNPNRAYKGDVLAGNCAIFLDFQKADYDKAVNEGKLVMLYFYATWCPVCKAELVKLHEAIKVAEVPVNSLVGFRVNYKDNDTDSSEVELARKFGITYQHTKIFERGGERLLKAGDSWDTERYLSEISKFIDAK